MEAVDYKYRYRFEVPKDVTLEDWEKVRYQREIQIGDIMEQRGFNFVDYNENAQHILMEEICAELGSDCYSRRPI